MRLHISDDNIRMHQILLIIPNGGNIRDAYVNKLMLLP